MMSSLHDVDDSTRGDERSGEPWDRVAAGWEKWWPTIEGAAQPVSDRLIDLADVAPGQRVLDIATGIGEPALSAARRVGLAGAIVATDLSARMLAIARARATAAGLRNVELVQADAERLDFPDGSFDAILCRWGLESLSDPARALAAMRRSCVRAARSPPPSGTQPRSPRSRASRWRSRGRCSMRRRPQPTRRRAPPWRRGCWKGR